MKPGPKGLEAIKEAIIAKVPRDRLEDNTFDLEDWVNEQLTGGNWLFFNREKVKDINYMYQLQKEIVLYFS